MKKLCLLKEMGLPKTRYSDVKRKMGAMVRAFYVLKIGRIGHFEDEPV